MIRAIIAAAILVASLPATAQVFKCSEGGKTVYSQTPCGSSATVIDATPATGEVDPYAAIAAEERARRQIRQVEAIERRRELNRQLTQIEIESSRIRDEVGRGGDTWCNYLEDKMDRHEAYMRKGERASMYEWRKTEKELAQKKFDRDCK